MTDERPNSVINALKRLERAGLDNSRTTEKLRRAARELADYLCSQLANAIPHTGGGYIELPRYYGFRSCGDHDQLWLPTDGWGDNEYGEVLNCHPLQSYPNNLPSRCAALVLAHDIATGWLDELHQWVESHTAEAVKAAAVLETELTTRTA